ncbi:hypothetical protein BCV72DRAFT_246357 [Rhizopus microsporus var. microsporus]|uniref:Pentatricopeptide repeat-containing protein-mitochondrial domain-containing protein n=2 Tax=Rhizopus microsporus TaxID=58291 RepID=A0A2G4T9W5_RHIZD|nr:uncharacterized protein RHIMIDRAFT_243804 [Rhizopus microsporus ATCC 52813]ORE00867.1 hypothetical protein BCV72DRAFT_246357 [Rhizopus microsporus var. microsporus]PHZ17785.1 hypothetical protein RHIMIDRAFT_243804 [Rhizopus microsporus ATCC 52813]
MSNLLRKTATTTEDKKKTLQSVLHLVEELRSAGSPLAAKTYNYVINAYSRAGESHGIIPLLQQMEAENITPHRVFFEQALELAGSLGEPVLQAHILQYMERHGYKKTPIIYNAFLKCAKENMELERAIDILDEMKKCNIKPSMSSYSELIDLAVTFEEPETAYELLLSAKLLKDFAEYEEPLYLNVLRSASYHYKHDIVKILWEEAITQKGYRPDEGLCLQVLNMTGKYADPRLASSVIKYIGSQGYTYRELHFQPLIQAFAQTGDIRSTFKLLHAMREAGVTPSKRTITSMSSIFAQDKSAITKAKAAIDEALRSDIKEIDILAVNLVIHVLASNRQYDEALSLYNRVMEAGVTPNEETLDAVLDSCIHSQDAALGEKIYNEMISKGISKTPSTLSKMVALMCTQEEYDDAFKYLEEMKHLDMIPYRGSYYKLVKTLAAAKDPRLNIALEDMKDYGYELSTHLQEYIEQHDENQYDEGESSAHISL